MFLCDTEIIVLCISKVKKPTLKMSGYFAGGEHLYCCCSENILESRLLIVFAIWSTLALSFKYVLFFKCDM